jgi:hypothetical protein
MQCPIHRWRMAVRIKAAVFFQPEVVAAHIRDGGAAPFKNARTQHPGRMKPFTKGITETDQQEDIS